MISFVKYRKLGMYKSAFGIIINAADLINNYNFGWTAPQKRYNIYWLDTQKFSTEFFDCHQNKFLDSCITMLDV